MKNECNIIKDILPLYAEKMVSEDTVDFIEEHLKNCPTCSSDYQNMQNGTTFSAERKEINEEAIVKVIKKLRKKLIKRICVATISICLAVLAVVVSLQVFPVYRVYQRKWDDSFTTEQRWMLAYIGTPGDRKIAIDIINMASLTAFSDTTHTYEENLKLYGELGQYAWDKHYFEEGYERQAFYETHSLELLSAHIDKEHGYMFVKYSQQAIGENGETVSGAWDIVSLWEIEKTADGNWNVIKITEHC